MKQKKTDPGPILCSPHRYHSLSVGPGGCGTQIISAKAGTTCHRTPRDNRQQPSPFVTVRRLTINSLRLAVNRRRFGVHRRQLAANRRRTSGIRLAVSFTKQHLLFLKATPGPGSAAMANGAHMTGGHRPRPALEEGLLRRGIRRLCTKHGPKKVILQ